MEDHLSSVTGKLDDYWEKELIPHFTPKGFTKTSLGIMRDRQLAAAWLHDVVDDTAVTIEELSNTFDPAVCIIVDAVTDGKGKNRTERHLNTYWRTRKTPDAIPVKLSDRWHNQKRTLENREYRYAKDYVDEYLYFKFALYEGNRPELFPFWNELDQQYEQLRELVNGRD